MVVVVMLWAYCCAWAGRGIRLPMSPGVHATRSMRAGWGWGGVGGGQHLQWLEDKNVRPLFISITWRVPFRRLGLSSVSVGLDHCQVGGLGPR